MKIKYLPKKESLRAQVEPLITAVDDCRKGRYNLYNFDWIDDYTKAELVLMGLCIGSNISSPACGSIASTNRNRTKEREEFTILLHQWFAGPKSPKSKSKRGQKNAKSCLIVGDYCTVFNELNEMNGTWAICAAMLIATEMQDHVPRLIDEVYQAMETGYEETCF